MNDIQLHQIAEALFTGKTEALWLLSSLWGGVKTGFWEKRHVQELFLWCCLEITSGNKQFSFHLS